MTITTTSFDEAAARAVAAADELEAEQRARPFGGRAPSYDQRFAEALIEHRGGYFGVAILTSPARAAAAMTSDLIGARDSGARADYAALLAVREELRAYS